MCELKETEGKPSLGTHMERLNQRGRWEESSRQDRNGKTFLNFLRFGFVSDILGYSSSADYLVSSEVQGGQEVRL